MNTLALFALVSVAIGGVIWVFVYPLISGERRMEQRKEVVARSAPVARAASRTQKTRREQVEGSLKDLEARSAKARSLPLQIRISQAGLTWSKRQFIIIAACLGVFAFLAFYMIDAGLLAALAVGFAAGFGLPLWILKFLKKRRETKFLAGFPDAVDIIVRGIKAGLPLLDSLKIIATEAQEPLRTEFRAIIETQAVGMPLGDACLKLYERIPVPEANFFGIVISIQQKAGGNLSEALGNLSKVLRERKKMKAKVQALSMEAKASAVIIGALPFVVALLVYLSSPNYIMPLFTTSTGNLILGCSGVWMAIGILVMRKMMNFDV
jgi:tight adherence protein B